MTTLILGCMLFGEGQGTKYDASIVEIDEIKFFKDEDDATKYGNKVLENGGDSYYLYDETDTINWCGNKRLFNKVKKNLVDWKKDVSLQSNHLKTHIMKNEQIKPKEEVPAGLRLEVYKQALEKINWKTNKDGLCHLLPMLLWGFTYPLEAHDKLDHNYWDTKYMFPELTLELPKISQAENENLVRRNALKRMIKKLEKPN